MACTTRIRREGGSRIAAGSGTGGSLVYGRTADGRFVLRDDADGDPWHPDYPVLLVDWPASVAYADWLAERTGRPWRLLGELEREKAARGVDERFFPWGDGFDPSWCCVRESHAGRPLPVVVDSRPVDTSPYGVRGLAGNVQDGCGDVFRTLGPDVEGDRVAVPSDRDPRAARVSRGGNWNAPPRMGRSAQRFRREPGGRFEYLGFRVGHSGAGGA